MSLEVTYSKSKKEFSAAFKDQKIKLKPLNEFPASSIANAFYWNYASHTTVDDKFVTDGFLMIYKGVLPKYFARNKPMSQPIPSNFATETAAVDKELVRDFFKNVIALDREQNKAFEGEWCDLRGWFNVTDYGLSFPYSRGNLYFVTESTTNLHFLNVCTVYHMADIAAEEEEKMFGIRCFKANGVHYACFYLIDEVGGRTLYAITRTRDTEEDLGMVRQCISISKNDDGVDVELSEIQKIVNQIIVAQKDFTDIRKKNLENLKSLLSSDNIEAVPKLYMEFLRISGSIKEEYMRQLVERTKALSVLLKDPFESSNYDGRKLDLGAFCEEKAKSSV